LYFVDANIFLELLLEQGKAEDCEKFLTKVKNGEEEAVITDFLVDAVVLVLESHGRNSDDLATFISSLSAYKGLKVYFLSLVDRLFATRHMKEFGLDFDDATTYQAMKRVSINTLVSFDHDFDAIQGLKRMELDTARF